MRHNAVVIDSDYLCKYECNTFSGRYSVVIRGDREVIHWRQGGKQKRWHLVSPLNVSSRTDTARRSGARLTYCKFLVVNRTTVFYYTHPARERELPNGYCLMKDANNVIDKVSTTFPLGVIQTMDYCGAELGFEKVNIYSETKTLRIGQDRLRSNVIFEYTTHARITARPRE